MNFATIVLLLGLLALIVLVIGRPVPRLFGFRPSMHPSRAEWLAAQQRAQELLEQVLGPEVYANTKLTGFLDVPSPSISARIYRIPITRGQVEVVEHGELVMKLCVVPATPLPDGDIVVMHKLMIEGNEDHYLQVANRFGPVPYSFYR